MSYSRDHAAPSRPRWQPAPFVVGVLVAVFAVWLAAPAEAANVRVRSISTGKATHYIRADRTVDAPRIFTQGLSLWGYDLLGDKTGSTNAHVSFRYHTDFSLEPERRDDPHFSHRWNEIWLDLAYLDWEPFEAMRFRVGRQWTLGALGPRDFDGLAWRWQPEIEAGVRARFNAYAGRDVQRATGRFDPATFDVQGLPNDDTLEPDKLEGTHLVAGAGAGLTWGRTASVELNWRRRFAIDVDAADVDGDTVVGSERFGAAASASIRRDMVVTGHGSYHSQLQKPDRAGLQLSWTPAFHRGSITAGIDHRHPWFDSSSIFNIFGARPFQGSFAVYRYPLEALRTELQLRGWGRIYHGDDAATVPGVEAQDERTIGSAVSHTTKIGVASRTLNWRSVASYQTSLDRGSDQVLGDVRLRMPIWRRNLFISARGLALGAFNDHHRRGDGYATTGVLGLDVPIGSLGVLSAAVETTGGSFYPTHTNAYATFTLDHWP